MAKPKRVQRTSRKPVSRDDAAAKVDVSTSPAEDDTTLADQSDAETLTEADDKAEAKAAADTEPETDAGSAGAEPETDAGAADDAAADTSADDADDDADAKAAGAKKAAPKKTEAKKDAASKAGAKKSASKKAHSAGSAKRTSRSGNPAKRASSRKTASYSGSNAAAVQPNPRWFLPVMLGILVLGLLWLIVFYISGGQWPVESWGNWNLLVGFAIMVIGLGMSTRWR